jgi:hypothetical protein
MPIMTFQKILTKVLCATLIFIVLSGFSKELDTEVPKDKKYPYSLANNIDFKELVTKLEGVRYRLLIIGAVNPIPLS